MSRKRWRLQVGALLVVVTVILCWLFQTNQRAPESRYLAASTIPDLDAIGGFGPCINFPKDLAGKDWGEAGTISLIAVPDEHASYPVDPADQRYQPRRGFALRVVNRTDKPVAFAAINSCLYLTQEALDWKGTWRPIEDLPSSGCGNSYHHVFLDRDQYWEFPATKPSGWFETRIRFRLELGRERVLYSNEFDGAINFSQFASDRR